jgi:hypothetical protein
MDGFLVVLRKEIADVPVSLHGTLTQAREAAERLAESPGSHMPQCYAEMTCWTSEGGGDAFGVAIVWFENGRPVSLEIGREVEETFAK